MEKINLNYKADLNYDEILKSINESSLAQKLIKELCLDTNDIKNNYELINNYIKINRRCEHCKSMSNCDHSTKGHRYGLKRDFTGQLTDYFAICDIYKEYYNRKKNLLYTTFNEDELLDETQKNFILDNASMLGLDFVSKISEDIDIDTASGLFEDSIRPLNSYLQDIWIRLFRLFTEDISKDKASFIAKMLFVSVYQLSDDPDGCFSSPRRKAVLYLSELLLKVDEKSLDEFAELAVRSYSKLEVVSRLVDYLKQTDGKGTVSERISLCYENMCKSVVGENPKEKINLYADEHYHFHNIHGLRLFCKDVPDTLRGYILDIAAEDSIYRILGDFVSYEIGGGFSYSIPSDIYNLLLNNSKGIDLTSKLDELLGKRPAETESEKLVLEIYKGREKLNR